MTKKLSRKKPSASLPLSFSLLPLFPWSADGLGQNRICGGLPRLVSSDVRSVRLRPTRLTAHPHLRFHPKPSSRASGMLTMLFPSRASRGSLQLTDRFAVSGSFAVVLLQANWTGVRGYPVADRREPTNAGYPTSKLAMVGWHRSSA